MKANFEKGTKICPRCRKELPISCFNKCKSRSDGLSCRCKECRAIINKRWYNKDIEQSRKRKKNSHDKMRNVFQRMGHVRGNSGMLKRDYELTEDQLKRRERSRKEGNYKSKNNNAQGILIWYDGKLDDLSSKEYKRAMTKEYYRQKRCAMRGYVARVTPSEHFLFDFDLEQMLKDNVYNNSGGCRKYITKWWKGEIRHWTVNDGIWKEG